jgi:uncharacterized repeat protein (TIGR02543 family)
MILAEASDERDWAMVDHLDRWGEDFWGYALWGGAWESQLNMIEDWLYDRSGYVWDHIMDNLDLDGTYPLQLWVEPVGSGSFEVSTIQVESPFFGTYFQGLPVEVTAVAKPGFTFVGWEDPSLGTDPTVTLLEDDGTVRSLVALFE